MAKKQTIRVRQDVTLLPITNKQQADESLKKIGELQLSVREHEAQANTIINGAKADLELAAQPLKDEIDRHLRSLEAFATNNRDSIFGKARSIALQFGKFGWRKGTPVIEIDEDSTLDLIKRKFRDMVDALILTKESVNKKALGTLTDEQLARVGARRTATERFFAEPTLPEAVDYGESKK